MTQAGYSRDSAAMRLRPTLGLSLLLLILPTLSYASLRGSDHEPSSTSARDLQVWRGVLLDDAAWIAPTTATGGGRALQTNENIIIGVAHTMCERFRERGRTKFFAHVKLLDGSTLDVDTPTQEVFPGVPVRWVIANGTMNRQAAMPTVGQQPCVPNVY